jgi:hypothetical protein
MSCRCLLSYSCRAPCVPLPVCICACVLPYLGLFVCCLLVACLCVGRRASCSSVMTCSLVCNRRCLAASVLQDQQLRSLLHSSYLCPSVGSVWLGSVLVVMNCQSTRANAIMIMIIVVVARLRVLFGDIRVLQSFPLDCVACCCAVCVGCLCVSSAAIACASPASISVDSASLPFVGLRRWLWCSRPCSA